MENIEIITKVLNEAENPLKSGEIAELSGIEKKEVDKILKKLKKDEVIHSPKRCYYAPKN